ncbi:MAG: TldD/PmbA family protein [Candidatus Sericytochromatia bacterium]|nr:TldD/PmbA family protein [Candidatus Sericytochromatia bacterium]
MPVTSPDLTATLEAALASSPAEATEFILTDSREELTRFGDNAITQNVAKQVRSLSIRVQHQGREARVDTTQLHDRGIRQAIEDAMSLAALQDPDPAMMTMLEGPQTYRTQPDRGMRDGSPEDRAAQAGLAVRLCLEAGARAAGISAQTRTRVVILNSRGVHADATTQRCEYSVTADKDDGSGWAKQVVSNPDLIDAEAVAQRAVRKALASRHHRPLPPGHYPVVLEAAAVADLVRMFPWMAFNALDYLEGRHFALDRMGEQFFDPKLTIVDDIVEVPGLPFDYEGVPRQRVPLIDAGRFTGLVHDRATAARAGVAPTGHGGPAPNPYGAYASHLVVSPGVVRDEDLVRGLDKGLLVTQLHYLNVVDRMDLSVTGMTRSGTFWVEKGEIAYPVENMRFTDSLIQMLGSIDALSRDREWAAAFWEGTSLAPAMRLPRMHFSSPAGF